MIPISRVNHSSFKFAFIPSLLILLSFFPADSSLLSFKFLPGQVFRLNEYSSQVIKQTMMGKEQVTNSESRIDYIFKVINGSQEEYLLERMPVDLHQDSLHR